MSGPYSYVPPIYWQAKENFEMNLGGAFSFLTEGGPGENPLTFEVLNKIIPKDKYWPINEDWDYHCANPLGSFSSLSTHYLFLFVILLF